jgi:ADP-heptose:LPS heptosyltransferase
MARASRPLAALRALAASLLEVRRERYEVAIDFHGNLRSGLATYLSGARARVGFARGACKEANHIFTNVHVRPPPRRALHKVEKDLLLVRALGIEPDGVRPVVPIPTASRARAGAYVEGLGPGGPPLVALHPGVSRFGAFKQWAPERFAAVADRLAGAGVRAILTWGPGERDLAAAVADLAASRPPVAFETRSIQDLAALFERCAAVVGCDTGPLHLAAALGVPTVGLYGMKDPAVYGLKGPGRVEIVYKGVPCSPCSRRSCPDVICMHAIGAGDVAAALARILGRPV